MRHIAVSTKDALISQLLKKSTKQEPNISFLLTNLTNFVLLTVRESHNFPSIQQMKQQMSHKARRHSHLSQLNSVKL